jgi:YVTN family beta-propeller protein
VVDLVENGVSFVDRTPRPSVRRPTPRLVLLLGTLAIAGLLAAPIGLNGVTPAWQASHDGAPLASLFLRPGPGAGTAAGPRSLTASSLPSGVGPGANGILATLDLVHGQLVPGTDNRTQNGLDPIAAAYDPENQLLYVASVELNAVQVVNTTTRQVVDLISVPGGPIALVFDPAGHEIYAADYYSNNLSVINDTTNTVIGNIPIPAGVANVVSGPYSLVYDPLNQTVLVGQYGGYVCCTDNITVVDGATNRLVGEIPAPPDVIDLAYNSADHLLYALSNGYPGAIVGITNLQTGLSAGTWTPTVPSGYYTGIAVDPQAGLVYLASAGFDDYSNVTLVIASSGVVAHNTTILEPGSTFIIDSIVYSNATGDVYFTGSTGELYSITGSSGSLVGGALDGSCLGPVALTASGRPLVAPDACAETLVWLNGLTAVVLATSIVGADPVSVQQIPSTGDIAVVESGTQRLDLLDPTTGVVNEQTTLSSSYGVAPAATTVDQQTGWLYYYDYATFAELTTGPLVAYDTVAQAVLWTYPDCSGCVFDGLGDWNGSLYLTVIDTTIPATELVQLNASTGAVEGTYTVATYATWPDFALPQTSVTPIPGTSLVVVGSLPLATTFAFNITSDSVEWSRATGTATGPSAYLPASGLLALGAGNDSLSYGVIFVNASSGLYVGSAFLQGAPTSLAPGGGGNDAYVLENDSVLRVSSSSDTPVNVTVPAGGSFAGLFSLGSDGGIALPSEAYGAVFWIGALFNITGFTAVGATVQGESLSLQVNVTGGFGSDTFAYTGLPDGCTSSNTVALTCQPLTPGSAVITVRGNDSTGLPGPTAQLQLTLAPYPLRVNLSSATSYFLTGTSSTFSAGLPASEAGIASFLNYTWALDPAADGTLNRTNASTVTVTWATTGSVALVVTANFRGTEAKAQLNGSVIASSSTSSALGLSGVDMVLLVLVVVIVIVVVAVALIARSRGRSDAPPPPPPAGAGEPTMAPEEAPAANPSVPES